MIQSLSYISAPANIIPTIDICLLGYSEFTNLQTGGCSFTSCCSIPEGFLEYKPMYVGTVPVFTASDTQKAPIIERVQKILANPDSPDVPRLEAEINKLVYDLYEPHGKGDCDCGGKE